MPQDPIRPHELDNLGPVHKPQATDGIAITQKGQGQVSGADFTVPAHGTIDVAFTLHMRSVSSENMLELDEFVRNAVKASKKGSYDDLKKTSASGGLSFFSFFGLHGGVSHESSKHRMEQWGLSEENQQILISKMADLVMTLNTYKYEGQVANDKYDYSVTGNIFAVVMDADVTQATTHSQLRMLAPNPHLSTPDGSMSLPMIGSIEDVG